MESEDGIVVKQESGNHQVADPAVGDLANDGNDSPPLSHTPRVASGQRLKAEAGIERLRLPPSYPAASRRLPPLRTSVPIKPESENAKQERSQSIDTDFHITMPTQKIRSPSIESDLILDAIPSWYKKRSLSIESDLRVTMRNPSKRSPSVGSDLGVTMGKRQKRSSSSDSDMGIVFPGQVK